MSYEGFEYNDPGIGVYGGVDPYTGGTTGGYGGDMIGGGFIPGSGTKEKEKQSKEQTVTPLSIKQLKGATKDDEDQLYIVDQNKLKTVVLLGMIENKQEHATSIGFKINDGSGLFECKQWKNNTPNAISNINDGDLIRVFGDVREFDGAVHVHVYDSLPVLDFNEITHHLLDTILTHCIHTKGALNSGNAGAPMNTATPKRPGSGMGMGMSMGTAQIKAEGGIGGGSMQEAVMTAYRMGIERQQGLNFNDAFGVLMQQNVQINMDQLRKTVEILCNDGRLYTTIDEEHYKPTDE